MADLKRGGYAKDTRTGQVVRVKEIGGTNVLVRTAYKSDGLWVQRMDLTPVRDPHEWTGIHLVHLLVLVAATSLLCTGGWMSLAGVDTYERLIYGVLSPGALVLSQGARLLGLVRD